MPTSIRMPKDHDMLVGSCYLLQLLFLVEQIDDLQQRGVAVAGEEPSIAHLHHQLILLRPQRNTFSRLENWLQLLDLGKCYVSI